VNSKVQEGQRHRGLYGLLAKPAIYEFIQRLVGGPKGRVFLKNFVDSHVAPRQGSRILDIGCGPGTILKNIPETLNCHYCGFDMNPAYIEAAQAQYGHRGRFFCKRVSEASLDGAGTFDIVLAIGVLHHLNDVEAQTLIQLAHHVLVSGGYLVTLDPVFVPGQNRIARFLISRDRGKFVRSPEGYQSLAHSIFANVECTVLHNMLRLPYTHFVMKSCKGMVEQPTA
jgi:2-polyprenyl-3-methyl-5-hydroxy-6-metoxy-1,4-benzoquinol methylase